MFFRSYEDEIVRRVVVGVIVNFVMNGDFCFYFFKYFRVVCV